MKVQLTRGVTVPEGTPGVDSLTLPAGWEGDLPDKLARELISYSAAVAVIPRTGKGKADRDVDD